MTFPAVVAPLIAAVDGNVTGYFTSASARVASAADGPFRVLVSVFVVLWGLACWRGLIGEPLSDGIVRLFRIVLIGTIALNGGVYSERIANTFYETANELASVILPSQSVSAVSLLDEALDKGNDIALNFMDRVSALSVGGSIAAVLSALLVWIFTAIVVLYGAALVLISKVALGLLLAFGPLFILTLLFDSTRRFFEVWLHQAINFMLMYGLVAATIGLMFTLFNAQLDYAITDSTVSSRADFSALLGTLITGGACLVLLHQLPGVAAALGGGVHLGTAGAVGWSARKLGVLRPSDTRYDSLRLPQRAVTRGREMGTGTEGLIAPAHWIADRVRGSTRSNSQ